MARFFKTGNATRPYKKDGLIFEFEPLVYASGTWIGALEEGREERAEIIASYGPPVSEISEAEFLDLKKKLNKNSHISEVSEAKETEPTKTEEDAPVAVESLEDELDFRAPPAEDDIVPVVEKKTAKKTR